MSILTDREKKLFGVKTKIVREDYRGEDMVLVYEDPKTGGVRPVYVGDVVDIESVDAHAIVSGGRAPHKPGSSGRVKIGPDALEFFPSVIGAKWIRLIHLSEVEQSNG